MLTILFLIIASASVLGVILLAIVATGIRQEPSTEELSERTPNLTAVFVRRMLGVYVHKPNSPSNLYRYDRGDATTHDSHRPIR